MRNNKALISCFLSLLLALTLLLYAAGSTAFSVGEDITDAFTDPNFLAAVRGILNKPSEPIYAEDLLGITKLDVQSLNISSLSGVEYFVDLKHLSCGNNQLTELNLCKNTALVYLYCRNNQLTKLDVTNNTALVILECNYNYMDTFADIIGLEYTKINLDLEGFYFRFFPQHGQSNAETPLITKQPESIVVKQGEPATLSVMADVQSGTLSYQWFFVSVSPENTIIRDATNASYDAPTNNIGARLYYCVITNTDYSVTGLKTASIMSDYAQIRVTTNFDGKVLYQTSTIPATVSLYNRTGTLVDSTTTATDGSYSLTFSSSVSTGYTLIINKPGYLSYTITNLTLTVGEDIETIDMRQLAGDIDGDGVINATDLTYLLSEFNRNPADSAYPSTDINGDGIVNATDLTYLLAGFNKRNVEIII